MRSDEESLRRKRKEKKKLAKHSKCAMKSSYLCNVKQTDGIYAPIREKMRTSKGVKTHRQRHGRSKDTREK